MPPQPLSSFPHSTSHLPPCQCLSCQVGPGRERRTGWKRLENWVTLGGLVEGRLGGARQGSLCLLPEGPAPPLLGHLWGQVARILFPRTASHRSRGSWGPCRALATPPPAPPSIPQPPTSRDRLKPPQGDLPHLISAHTRSTSGQARPRRPCGGGRGVEPFPWCWLFPPSGCRGYLHPMSTS